MHGHGWHGHVHLTTGRALLGQLAVKTSVSLFVPAQVGRRRVCFPTLVARMTLDGPRTADNFPPWSPVCDVEGIHSVSLAHRVVSVNVSGADFGLRAVSLVRVRCPIITVDSIIDRLRRRHFDGTIAFSIVNRGVDVLANVTYGRENKRVSLINYSYVKKDSPENSVLRTCNKLCGTWLAVAQCTQPTSSSHQQSMGCP